MKRLLQFIGQLILIAFLTFVARECWFGYKQEKENERFAVEGRLVTVRIQRILNEKRDWKDYTGYSEYIAFLYKDRTYDLRYLPDSGWVGEGTVVRLLYCPALDRFLQPSRLRHPEPNVKVSRLIDWSVAGSISYAHRWLLAFLALSTTVALFCFSLLYHLTSLPLFDFLARICKVVGAVGLLIYFNWNTFSNYAYFQRIRGGIKQTVTITATEKQSAFNQTGSNDFHFYYYAALVPDAGAPNGLRRIMISASDYDQVHKGDFLEAYYQSSMDEMMSVNFSFEIYKWIFLGLIWMIALYFLFGDRKPKNA